MGPIFWGGLNRLMTMGVPHFLLAALTQKKALDVGASGLCFTEEEKDDDEF